jgi:hypothetical protein
MTDFLKGKLQDSVLLISCANGQLQYQYISWPLSLTFQSLALSLRTTRFNIQKFYMMLTLR